MTSCLHFHRMQQLISTLCSRTIFVVLLSNVLLFSGLMYCTEQVTFKNQFIRLSKTECFDHFSQAVHNQGYTSCIFYLICLLCSLNWTFVLCYAATTATSALEDISKYVYSSKWYEYPPEMQKCLILLMARSQRPVYFTGMRMVRCTLDVFMRVKLTLYSFFILLTITNHRLIMTLFIPASFSNMNSLFYRL